MAQRRSPGSPRSGAAAGPGTETAGPSRTQAPDPFSAAEERVFFADPGPTLDNEFFDPPRRTRWRGPKAGLALVLLGTAYWSTVAFLVERSTNLPIEFVTVDPVIDPQSDVFGPFDDQEPGPVPGTIPWQWSGCATGRITSPCPIGLAPAVDPIEP